MRMPVGRLRDVLSSINFVKWSWEGLVSNLLFGKYLDTILSRSGIILLLVLAVHLHMVNRWTMSSFGAGKQGF